MLNERQKKLIKVLEEANTWMRGKNLSMLLDVSDRTIRSDIEKINKENSNCITSSSQHGYRYHAKAFKKSMEDKYEVPQTTEERCFYIVRKLLFERCEVNLSVLLDELCISEFTLENDLKKVKSMLKSYLNLTFVRNKKFLSLLGSEEEKRKLYKQLLDKETKGNFLNLNTLASLFKNFDFIMVKDILVQTLHTYDFQVRETAFPMLMMHVGIAIERILRRNYIYNETVMDDLQESREYQIASNFYAAIKEKIQLEVVEEEIILLSLLLMGRKSFFYTNKLQQERKADIDEEQLVISLLDDIKKVFDVDFTEDIELGIGLRIHIRSLIDRMKNKTQAPNVFLSEIKRKYPLVFEMGVQVCKFLEEKLSIRIDENEIGFIALHLGVAYERIQTDEPYRVVLIVAHDENFSRMCKNRILHKFAERLDIIACHNFLEEQAIKQLQPDFIITTSQIQHQVDVLTIQISMFMNLEDESMIFQTLNKLDKQRFHKKVSTQIHEFINPEYFFHNLDVKTPEEAITFMCEKLKKDGAVDEQFKNSVLERERISATSFFYSFATPHSLQRGAIHSNISVALLKKPIAWGEFDVKLVLLLAIHDEDKKILKLIFDWLSQAIHDVESFARILESKNYNEFIERFINFEYIK